MPYRPISRDFPRPFVLVTQNFLQTFNSEWLGGPQSMTRHGGVRRTKKTLIASSFVKQIQRDYMT